MAARFGLEVSSGGCCEAWGGGARPSRGAVVRSGLRFCLLAALVWAARLSTLAWPDPVGSGGGQVGSCRIWPAATRIWSCVAMGLQWPYSVVVQGATIRSLPVLLGGGLLTWAKATAPAGAGDGDARGCRLPPWRHRCHGDFPFEAPGETHVPGPSRTADGVVSHSFLKASDWWIVWWLLTAGWTVVVTRSACAGVLGEAIRALTRLLDALRLRRRCRCCDVDSAACDSSSGCGLGRSLPFGCTNSLEASWMVSVDWSSSSTVVVFSCSSGW